MRRPLAWQVATVREIRDETPQAKTFTLALPEWEPHLPGQHYDIRLTAEDGYQAQRSYSIASSPDRQGVIALTVERIEDGEVSAFLHDVLVVGDRIEVRGPIGGYFVWEAGLGGPLLLVAGGSGVVPLMAMLRHRAAAGSRVPAVLLYSSRSREQAIYFDELERLAAAGNGLTVLHTLTRSQPPDWRGYARRIDPAMLRDALAAIAGDDGSVQVFVCGPTPLVEAVAEGLTGLGLPAGRIKTERFGPTGA